MDDKDHVFARFKDDKPASADRRETLTIPRRAGAPGSRSVEVVHVRSGGAVRDRPRQDPRGDLGRRLPDEADAPRVHADRVGGP